MGEGFPRPPEIERGPEPEAKRSPELGRPTPLEILVAQRWDAINESLQEFREREVEESLDPKRFLTEVTEEWERKHARSEQFDVTSPFDRASFLLALLIEKGAEWSAQKRAAVRRMTVGFVQQSVGAMTIRQQEIFNKTVLTNPEVLREIGSPAEGEQKLITGWLKDTVGRGVK